MQETQDILLSLIDSNRFQPRLSFNEEAIDELAESIKGNGLIQPISVRRNGARFEIIAGERRYRAVTKLQYHSIPAFILEVDDAQLAEMALVENIQREDLSAIEEAKAFHAMIKSHALTQEAIARRVGKSQSSIANKIRLLNLPDEIQVAVTEKVLSERHARALLGLSEETQKDVFHKIQHQHLNVRQTEALVEQVSKPVEKKRKHAIRGITRSIQVAINTLLASVKMIEKTGVKIDVVQEQNDEAYEIRVRFIK